MHNAFVILHVVYFTLYIFASSLPTFEAFLIKTLINLLASMNFFLLESILIVVLIRDNIGYPIAECASDGKFILSKPPNTGGLVSPSTVAEQVRD